MIQHCDALELLSSVSSDTIQHINIDPPYGINYAEWDKINNYQEFIGPVLKECARVLKVGGNIGVWGTLKSDNFILIRILLGKLLSYQNTIHWSYNWGGRTTRDFASKVETCWVFSKGTPSVFNAPRVNRKVDTNPRTGELYTNGTIPTTVWQYNLHTMSKEAKETRWHPTVKPLFIIGRMVESYSNPGDLILDCFSGSGTTAVACQELGRNFVGCDNNKDYVEQANARLK